MSRPATPRLPVYLQVAELLTRQIKAGYWHQGERLPTEAELAEKLRVAVGTLRKALALLADQGVLHRVQGSGTYVKLVKSGKPQYELFRLETLEGPGLPTAQILDVTRMQRPDHVPPLSEGNCPEVWRVRRLRFISTTPVALEEIWFNAELCPDLSAEELGDSMYLFYQQSFQIWISRVEDRLSAKPAPSWSCPPLGLQAHGLAGFIERTSFTAVGVVFEFSNTWFDPAVCRYTARWSQ
ncbi:MAG: GntR family transcriptional regulator [Betaproteobacteria bacterium]|nr:GntR family transcriptional regulator [Betaproteobacteria bacterium]